MSQRFLIPTNLFYSWRDPWPPEFPQPNTGDIYFNVSSQTLRVFYENDWHDAGGGGGGGGGGGDEVSIQDAEPTTNTLELWVKPDASGFLAAHDDLSGLDAGDTHPQYLNVNRANDLYVKVGKVVISNSAASGTPEQGTLWFQW